MHTLSVTATIAAHTLAWALLHSLWQALLIFVALAILLKIKPQINATAKYALSFGALATQALWFIGTWITEYTSDISSAHYTVSSGSNVIISAAQPITPAELPAAVTGTFMPAIEHYFPVLLIIYSLGLTAMLSRFLVNIIQVRNLRSHGVIPIAPRYLDLLKACQVKVGLPSSVQLFLSNRISVPMMLGTLKPVILLPLATINHLTTDQVEAILLHELAHIKRHDYLLNLFQTTIETILFFNPFIWLTSAIIRREREHCCDDIVVACTPSPMPYAKALTILEDIRLKNSSLAMAATGRSNHLFHRIKRIIEMKNTSTTSSRLTIIAVVAIALSFSAAMFTFTPSFAQKSKNEKSDTTAKKTVYKHREETVDRNGKKTVTEKVTTKPVMDGNEHDTNAIQVRVTIQNDTAKEPDKQVYTKVIIDQSGKQKIIRTHKTGNGSEEEIVTKNKSDMYKDMEQMAEDLKQMAKNLTDAHIDINAVDWDELKAELQHKLADLDKSFNNDKLHKEIQIELKKAWETSTDAIKEAQKEIEKATVLHKKVAADAKKEAMEAKKQTAQKRKNVEKEEEEDHEQGIFAQQNMDNLLKKMKADGLIDGTKGWNLQVKNKTLYIDGKKQPESVYNKYRDLLDGDFITINLVSDDKAH